MGNSSSSNKVSAQDRAILDLKVQRDKLHQYQKRITTITTRETEIARECLRQGDKKRALLALRRKKYQETLLSKTDQQLAQLQALTSDVEFALVQKDVLFGLQQGTAVLKEIHREMGGLEKVELIMSESEEAQAYQREINEMLSGKMSNEDEDEVEDELEIMAQEAQAAAAAAAAAEGERVLPDAPSGNPTAHNEDETLPKNPLESPGERLRRRAKERARQIHDEGERAEAIPA